MLVKLNFTENKRIDVLLRIFADVVNTASVTSISALVSRSNSDYHPTLLQGLDAANSQIIRTVNPSLVKAHYYRAGAVDTGRFTMEFPVHDDNSQKWHLQFSNTTNGTYNAILRIGNGLTGGTIESSQLSMSSSISETAASGTELTVSNSFAANTLMFAGAADVRTFWAYVTNNGLIWCATRVTTVANGFSTTYNNGANFLGPFFFSQYTRFDHHNNMGNGIIPVAYSNPRTAGTGFGLQTDYTTQRNPVYNGNETNSPVRVINLISAAATAASTNWPMIYHLYVDHTVSGYGSAASSATLPTTSTSGTINAGSIGKRITTSASERYPTADRTLTGFALLPLGWTHTHYGNHGGNISDRSGFYLFNGDYQPGDEFSARGKIWIVWPTFHGFADRLGIAIPKE